MLNMNGKGCGWVNLIYTIICKDLICGWEQTKRNDCQLKILTNIFFNITFGGGVWMKKKSLYFL